jgi:hypothetical protein
LLLGAVLLGEPVSIPDRVGGRLSPEHALEAAVAQKSSDWKTVKFTAD